MGDEVFEEDLFKTIPVKELQDEDFLLASVERIVLKATGCSVILIYSIKDEVSRGLRVIWDELADSFAGVQFYALNASRRINVMRAWQEINDDEDHPLSAYRIRGYPTILVYREGGQPGISWPKAFYNGQLSLQYIQNWVLTLACTPGYTETPAIREGIVSDQDIYVDDGRGSQQPASSLDFQDGFFRVDEATVDEYLQTEEEFADRVILEGSAEPEVMNDLQDFRPAPDQNIRVFTSTDGFGSAANDPGFVQRLGDDALNF